MLQKLKTKQNTLQRLKKIGASFLLALILLSLVPNFALAEQGVADDGRPEGQENRTFDSQDIVLKSTVDVTTNLDCNSLSLSEIQKLNYDQIEKTCKFSSPDFLRMGNEKNKSYMLIRMKLFLDSPEQLNFAPASSWSRAGVDLLTEFVSFGFVPGFARNFFVPKVDYVKGKEGFLWGGNFDVLHPLLGFGATIGVDDKVTCKKKDIALNAALPQAIGVWDIEKPEYINFCDLPVASPLSLIGGLITGGQNGNFGGNLTTKISKETSFKSGDLMETFIFAVDAGGNLDKWGLAQEGKPQKIAVWPYLYVNLGNRQFKDKVLGSVEDAVLLTALAKGTEGIYGFIAENVSGVMSGKIRKEDLKNLISRFVKTKAPDLPEKPAQELIDLASKTADRLAEASEKSGKKLGTIAEFADKVLLEMKADAAVVGASDSVLAMLAGNAARTIIGQGTDDAKLIVKATEAGVAKVVSGGEKSNFLVKLISKYSTSVWGTKVIKIGGPVLKVLGPVSDVFVGVQVTKTAYSYMDGPLTYYDTNKAVLGFQVYKTDAEAQQAIERNDPVPAGFASTNLGTSKGAGQTIGKTGSPLLGFINSLIAIILGFIQELIFTIFYYLIAPAIQAMLSIHTYTDTFAAVIYPGWEVVRNLSNIMFIVAIIAIGLGTLFRVESYQYKHLLVQLIVAALLVNFSLVISQVILGVADTVQSQFLPNNADVIRALGRDLIVGYRSTVYNGLPFASSGFFSTTVTPFFFLSLAIGSFVVFAAIAGFLVVRMVMLWVLLMLSPLAYLAGVLPSTESYRSQWWGYFIKYAFFTPIMAFFLNMAAVISDSYKNSSVLQQISYADFGNSSLSAFVFKVFSNILILVFLFLSIKVAEEAGIFGADVVSKFTQGGMALPFKGAGWLGGVGYNWLQKTKRDKTGAWSQEHDKDGKHNPFYKKLAFGILNADTVIKAFQADSKKDQERALHISEAAGLDLKRQTPFFKEPGLASEYAEAQLHYIDQLAKERQYSGNEPLAVREARKTELLARTSDKQRANLARQHLQLMENKGGNALLESYKDENGNALFEWTPEGINAWLEKMVKDGVYTKQMAGELRSRMSKIGYETRQTVLYEGTNYHGDSVHPILFDTERVNGRWQIAGKHEFEAIRDEAYNQLDNIIKNDAEVKSAYEKATDGLTGEDLQAEDERFREQLVSKVRGEFIEQKGKFFDKFGAKIKNSDPHHKHHVENYAHWMESMAQKQSNLAKVKNANDKFTDTHWNSIASEVAGKAELQEASLVQFETIGEGDFFGLGRGQVQEKTLGILRSVLQESARLKEQRKEYIVQQYKLKGKKLPSDAKLEKDANIYVALMGGLVRAKNLGADGGKQWAMNEIKRLYPDIDFASEESLKWLVKADKEKKDTPTDKPMVTLT